MASTLITVAVLAALTIAGGSHLRSSKAATGNTEKVLRGGRKLQGMYCSNIQCPERTTPIEYDGTTVCGETCVASECCEAKCSYHQCPERSTPVDDADEVLCDDLVCTDDLCCEAFCSYYQCANGETLVEDAGDIVCPGCECGAALCCKVPTKTANGVVAAPDSTAAPTDSATTTYGTA